MVGFGFKTGVTQPTSPHNDGWVNILTGLGMANRDKRMAGTYGTATVLDRVTLEEMYRGDSMAAKVVDTLPNDMTRAWIEYQQGDDAEVAQAVMQALDDLGVQSAIREGLSWGRLYGGAVAVLGIDDGQDAEMPVNLNGIKALRFLNVLDRHQVNPGSRYQDPTKPKYGQPEFYELYPLHGGQRTLVHESRIIRFGGVRLPDRLKELNSGWDDSILNRLFNALRGYHTSHDSVGTILTDFTQSVYRLKGLAKLIATQGGDTTIAQRMQVIELCRSIVRGIVLDEDESWERQTTSVAGLADLIDRTERRLIAETGMPHTLLLGESPGASLGEGGQSQNRDWYDHVAAEQEGQLRKPIRYVIELLLRSKEGPTGGRLPGDWGFKFKSLWQLDDTEQAKIRKTQAETDAIYHDRGVLSPAEIAISRFGGDGYSTDTVLDMEMRGAMAEADQLEGEAQDGSEDPNPRSTSTGGDPGDEDPEEA